MNKKIIYLLLLFTSLYLTGCTGFSITPPPSHFPLFYDFTGRGNINPAGETFYRRNTFAVLEIEAAEGWDFHRFGGISGENVFFENGEFKILMNHTHHVTALFDTFVKEWPLSTNNQQPDLPIDILVGKQTLYICDYWANAIWCFDLGGNALPQFPLSTQLQHPTALAYQEEKLYICDATSMQIYTTAGEKLYHYTFDANYSPLSMDLDQDQNIYLACLKQVKIMNQAENGYFLSDEALITLEENFEFKKLVIKGEMIYALLAPAQINIYNLTGTKITSFQPGQEYFRISDIKVNNNGEIFLAETRGVKVYDNNGTFLYRWGDWGFKTGQFTQLTLLAFDNEESTYLLDQAQNKVAKFRPIP